MKTKTAEEILAGFEPNREYPSYYHESNVLKAMEEFANQSKWVPVTEPPDDGEVVWVYGLRQGDDFNTTHKARFYPEKGANKQSFISRGKEVTATHWQPLPSPPQTPNEL